MYSSLQNSHSHGQLYYNSKQYVQRYLLPTSLHLCALLVFCASIPQVSSLVNPNPVIFWAHQQSLLELAQELKCLTLAARQGKLSPMSLQARRSPFRTWACIAWNISMLYMPPVKVQFSLWQSDKAGRIAALPN